MEIRDEYLEKIERGIDRFINWVVVPFCAFGLIVFVVHLIMLAMAR